MLTPATASNGAAPVSAVTGWIGEPGEWNFASAVWSNIPGGAGNRVRFDWETHHDEGAGGGLLTGAAHPGREYGPAGPGPPAVNRGGPWLRGTSVPRRQRPKPPSRLAVLSCRPAVAPSGRPRPRNHGSAYTKR